MKTPTNQPAETPSEKRTQDLLKTLYAQQPPQAVLAKELGEPYIRYRERWDQASRFLFRPDFPIHLDLELSYACNLRCIMCPYGVEDYQHPSYKGTRMDRQIITKIFREGQQHNLSSVRFNVLNEPLLNKDLPDLISMARDHGVIDTFITTNGTLLTRQKSRELIQSGLNHILISIDGSTAETYESIRIGASYKQVVENLYAFLDERNSLGKKLPLLRLTFVKMKVNEHEVADFIEKWLHIVDYLGIAGYLNNINNDELNGRLSTSSGTMDNIDRFYCYQPWARGVIYANGDFFPCCANYSREHPLFNAHKMSVYEMWNSKQVRFLQDIHQKGEYFKHPVCKTCISKRDNFSF